MSYDNVCYVVKGGIYHHIIGTEIIEDINRKGKEPERAIVLLQRTRKRLYIYDDPAQAAATGSKSWALASPRYSGSR